MGYGNGYSQFAHEVNSWKLNAGYECTYDAVQKLFCSGKLAAPRHLGGEWCAIGGGQLR